MPAASAVRAAFRNAGGAERSMRVRPLMLTPVYCRVLICASAAVPLPAHPRGTRCKDVLLSADAASMPRQVPRRWAGKDQSRWSLRVTILKATSRLSGAVSSPIAGPCGGMDAATEPPRKDSRRVPQAVRALRAPLTELLTWAPLHLKSATAQLAACAFGECGEQIAQLQRLIRSLAAGQATAYCGNRRES